MVNRLSQILRAVSIRGGQLREHMAHRVVIVSACSVGFLGGGGLAPRPSRCKAPNEKKTHGSLCHECNSLGHPALSTVPYAFPPFSISPKDGRFPLKLELDGSKRAFAARGGRTHRFGQVGARAAVGRSISGGDRQLRLGAGFSLFRYWGGEALAGRAPRNPAPPYRCRRSVGIVHGGQLRATGAKGIDRDFGARPPADCCWRYGLLSPRPAGRIVRRACAG